MCEVSGQLKLCTCSHTDFEKAKHYWILHRFSGEKDLKIVGVPVPPFFIDEQTDLRNRELLGKLLNHPGIFDQPIEPADGDLLELSFQVNNDGERITYGFTFRENVWVEETYNCFDWMKNHNEEKQGKIINALKDRHD